MLQEQALEVGDFVPAGGVTHRGQEGIELRIGKRHRDRRHICHRHIHVLRIIPAVEQGGLASLTGAGVDPFAGIERLEKCHDAVVVGGGLLDGQVLPIQGIRAGIVEKAVLDDQLIGVKDGADLVLGGMVHLVAFGTQHHRAVVVQMA